MAVTKCEYCDIDIDLDEDVDHFNDQGECETEIINETLCFTCNGSGEGYVDGSKCNKCKGGGMEYKSRG